MCPDQSQAFKKVNDGYQIGIHGKKKKMTDFFLDQPLPGAPSRVRTKFGAKNRKTDFVGPILSQI